MGAIPVTPAPRTAHKPYLAPNVSYHRTFWKQSWVHALMTVSPGSIVESITKSREIHKTAGFRHDYEVWGGQVGGAGRMNPNPGKVPPLP